MALGKGRARKRKFVPPGLQLTSMMDMFTIIMLFLLVNFSAKPEALKLDSKMELPRSTAKMDYKNNIKLALTKESLQIEGQVIGTVDGESITGLDPKNLKASALYKRLRQERELADKGAKDKGDKTAEQHVLFLCDKKHSFTTINQIIKTAGMAGYPNLQFAVLGD